jgi:hypothetical protein
VATLLPWFKGDAILRHWSLRLISEDALFGFVSPVSYDNLPDVSEFDLLPEPTSRVEANESEESLTFCFTEPTSASPARSSRTIPEIEDSPIQSLSPAQKYRRIPAIDDDPVIDHDHATSIQFISPARGPIAMSSVGVMTDMAIMRNTGIMAEMPTMQVAGTMTDTSRMCAAGTMTDTVRLDVRGTMPIPEIAGIQFAQAESSAVPAPRVEWPPQPSITWPIVHLNSVSGTSGFYEESSTSDRIGQNDSSFGGGLFGNPR